MAWERKRNTETDAKGSRTLEHLMTFLRLEVQGEEMVQLAKSGFGTPIRKRDSPTERVKPTELMTASALASSEKSSETEIGLLIGADNTGKLLTGNLIEFDSGLTAIETKLGWTVIGKNKMKILPDGRYEVKFPWKCNSENLPSNKELTWKRHLRMMNKLRNGKFFDDYKSVFRQWEDLNIIERVPEVELNNECHYLPHRPVVKLDSATTKIRPVFDASAREKGKPSLNDCLYKGVNLIELIPDILDRFRIYPVGIVADIEKAFLMLSVAPKDRLSQIFFPMQ
ncbi:integrase catalytic domain-containing protein [Trichonephila clavipes]|nr:integrase catalytic domain-containing protein [Trichonephila clavipes]